MTYESAEKRRVDLMWPRGLRARLPPAAHSHCCCYWSFPEQATPNAVGPHVGHSRGWVARKSLVAATIAGPARPLGVTRAWDNLSDYEFEALVGDLLSAELGIRFERFTRGRDGGIDLRHIPARGNRPDIVQAKHYRNSTLSSLRSAVKKEAKRLADTGVKPRSYRLATSLGLTPANKAELTGLLSPWVKREDHVLGRDDLEALLNAHPSVERQHVKLWLASGTQLAALLRAGTHARSRVLAQDIARTLPLYVQGESFFDAHARLREQGRLDCRRATRYRQDDAREDAGGRGDRRGLLPHRGVRRHRRSLGDLGS